MGKLTHDADLLKELTSVCEKEGIRLGCVQAIGAVKKARLGFYDQQQRKCCFLEIDENLEITALIGNISIRDGKPMVHSHITLSDSKGRSFGGHLSDGTIVFACEFIITTCTGPDYFRDYDEETGLPLWKI